MKAVNLYEYFSCNEYPGRGIVLGRSQDGSKMLIGYFIMGRSENSRNRVFVPDGEGNPGAVHRFFFDYTDALPGQGHVIHTYRENGDPIPSFEGEPVLVDMADAWEEFGEKLWQALNPDNKVSLFVRSIDLATGKVQTKLYNKNK